MQIFKNIKKAIAEQKITIKNAAEAIEMTEVGFHSAIKNETFKLKNFITLANVLNISPPLLFNNCYNTKEDETININIVSEPQSQYQKKNDDLPVKEILNRISSLEKKIDFISKELDEKSQIIKGFMNGTITIVSK